MAKTFAQHLLALSPNTDTKSAADAEKVSSAEMAERPATTYASVVLMLAMGTSGAHAATDGVNANSGGISSASLNIGLVIPERLHVNGLASPRLQADGRGGLTGTSSACISGLGSGQYHLSALGSGKNGAFETTDGNRTRPYAVSYSDSQGAPQSLTMGEALQQLAGSGTTSGCEDNTANARLSIHLPDLQDSDPQSAPAPIAKISGALTLLLTPE